MIAAAEWPRARYVHTWSACPIAASAANVTNIQAAATSIKTPAGSSCQVVAHLAKGDAIIVAE